MPEPYYTMFTPRIMSRHAANQWNWEKYADWQVCEVVDEGVIEPSVRGNFLHTQLVDRLIDFDEPYARITLAQLSRVF